MLKIFKYLRLNELANIEEVDVPQQSKSLDCRVLMTITDILIQCTIQGSSQERSHINNSYMLA